MTVARTRRLRSLLLLTLTASPKVVRVAPPEALDLILKVEAPAMCCVQPARSQARVSARSIGRRGPRVLLSPRQPRCKTFAVDRRFAASWTRQHDDERRPATMPPLSSTPAVLRVPCHHLLHRGAARPG